MKKLKLFLVVALFMIVSSSLTYAAEDGEKGASTTAQEQAGERAVFQRFGDWFATVGRSEEQKTRIMEERNARRSERRSEREKRRAEQRRKQSEKQAEEGKHETERLRHRERLQEGDRPAKMEQKKTREHAGSREEENEVETEEGSGSKRDGGRKGGR